MKLQNYSSDFYKVLINYVEDRSYRDMSIIYYLNIALLSVSWRKTATVIIIPGVTEQIHSEPNWPSILPTHLNHRSPKYFTREISHFFILQYLYISAAEPLLSMMYPVHHTNKAKTWSYLHLDNFTEQPWNVY